MTRTLTHFDGSDQFWIYEPERLPDADTWDQSSGLVVTAEHGLVVLTSEYPGQITVTVDARDARPPQADAPDGLGGDRDWDDIVEASVVCHTGPLRVAPIDDADWVDDLPRLDTVGPGPYRVRVHARNRDVAGPDPDGFGSATDEYLIVSWPEPDQPPLLIKLTDRRGFSTRASLLL
jgi:hypothetical protein